jgi:metal-responsive CopG/Arc/MetJ family transcriptional regulator
MNKTRITIQIDEPLKQAIENTIRKNYPKLKTVSDVVRTALQQFLAECEKA